MTTIKRNKDFSTTGEYTVTIGNLTHTIYRDPESGWWYESVSGKHFSQCCIGFKKTEAVQTLEARANEAAKPAPATVMETVLAKAPVSKWQADQNKVDDAVKSFPATFGLVAFPGETFRVSAQHSYMNDSDVVQVYTERLCEDGVWKSFAKGTVTELKREVVSAPAKTIDQAAAPAAGELRMQHEPKPGIICIDPNCPVTVPGIPHAHPSAAVEALDEAIAMLETIANGKSYDALEYHQKLDSIKLAKLTPAQTVTVDAALWQRVKFFIEGMAIMGTVRQSNRDLHLQVVDLAQSIEGSN